MKCVSGVVLGGVGLYRIDGLMYGYNAPTKISRIFSQDINN
jgi:hypothetical protein